MVNVDAILPIAMQAGALLLHHYTRPPGAITVKNDGSPLTAADMASHTFLVPALTRLNGLPVLSEEDIIPYSVRRLWTEYWLIDPLDGTKDFLARTDEFTINIALIRQNRPQMGIIYAPVLSEMYFAERGKGAFVEKAGKRIRLPSQKAEWSACLSRFSNAEAMTRFLEQNAFIQTTPVGAALKFARVAEGAIGLYPRFVPSQEWDTAAGTLIVTESGGFVRDLVTGEEPVFNKEHLGNNPFLAGADSFRSRVRL